MLPFKSTKFKKHPFQMKQVLRVAYERTIVLTVTSLGFE